MVLIAPKRIRGGEPGLEKSEGRTVIFQGQDVFQDLCP